MASQWFTNTTSGRLSNRLSSGTTQSSTRLDLSFISTRKHNFDKPASLLIEAKTNLSRPVVSVIIPARVR
jgi:hypothetical protein